MTSLSRFAVLAVAVPLALGACKKKPPVVAPAPVTPVEQPAAPPAAAPPVVAVETPRPVGPTAAEMRALILETVYFEYDSDAIRADAQTALEKKVPLLAANSAVRITVSGHCDERGSDEYNIALGRRRAESVKRFLTDRGIDASRIETISFGRERPAVQGSTEDAYAKNRRDEFLITAGGDNLKSP
jgi:peptidoglycan-associated lipoprotein